MHGFQKNAVGRVGGFKLSAAEQGPYRLRQASGVSLAGTYHYGQRPRFGAKVAAVALAVLRLTLLTFALLAWVAGLYLYRDTPVDLSGFGAETPWLTVSHLLVLFGFFIVGLTNRRYGPAYAFAQVLLTGAVVAALSVFGQGSIDGTIPMETVPPLHEAVSFAVAFLVASFVSIVAFEGARGPHWWTAPLIGFLAAGIVYPVVFFALQIGSDAAWLGHGLQYITVMAAGALLLLVPFWLMRAIVPPTAGFGGY